MLWKCFDGKLGVSTGIIVCLLQRWTSSVVFIFFCSMRLGYSLFFPDRPERSNVDHFVVRSLEDFDSVVKLHGKTLQKDLLIKHHLGLLHDQLLESNLLKIIQVRVPYAWSSFGRLFFAR